jgi:hypothetical protein
VLSGRSGGLLWGLCRVVFGRRGRCVLSVHVEGWKYLRMRGGRLPESVDGSTRRRIGLVGNVFLRRKRSGVRYYCVMGEMRYFDFVGFIRIVYLGRGGSHLLL